MAPFVTVSSPTPNKWVDLESPGYFCAATETGRDIMQAIIDGGTWLLPHVFDTYMLSDKVDGKDPILLKKLVAGDARWA